MCVIPTPPQIPELLGKWERSEEEASLRKHLTGQGHHCPPLHPSYHSVKANKLAYFSWELKQFSWGKCLPASVCSPNSPSLHSSSQVPTCSVLFICLGEGGILCFLKYFKNLYKAGIMLKKKPLFYTLYDSIYMKFWKRKSHRNGCQGLRVEGGLTTGGQHEGVLQGAVTMFSAFL